MVLPAPAAHDEAAPHEASWLHRLKLSLRLSKAAILLHVDHARPERLGELVRSLAEVDPRVDVAADVRTVATAPEGSLLVLLPTSDDAAWLNLERPMFARRGLKVVLFCDRETSTALKHGAPDFFDWISQHQDCPPGPVAHAVLGLRAALAAEAPVVWAGSGGPEDVERAWSAFSAAFPGQTLRWLSPTQDYAAFVTDVQSAAADAWVACRPRAAAHLRRFRWALAEAGRRSHALVVTDSLPCPGYWPVHDRMMPFLDARRLLEEAGSAHAGAVAALTGLEPEAVELARALLRHGVGEDHLVELLVGAEDPGATLAAEACLKDWFRIGKVSWAEAAERMTSLPLLRLRGNDGEVQRLRAARLQSIASRISKRVTVSHMDLGDFAASCPAPASMSNAVFRNPEAIEFAIECVLRRGAGPWLAELAALALVVGDPGAAAAWGQRALSLERNRHLPLRLWDVARHLSALGDPRGADLEIKLQRYEEMLRLMTPGERLRRAGKRLLDTPIQFFRDSEFWRLIPGTAWYLAIFFFLQSAIGDFLETLRRGGWFLLLVPLMMWLDKFKFFAWAGERWRAWRRTSPSEETARWMRGHLDYWRPSLERGDYAEAERRLRGLLNDARAKLGPEHPLYRAIHHGHALALVGLGEGERALRALGEAVALEGRLVGVDQESFAVLIPTLAEALARTGRAAQAEMLLRKLLGPDGRLPGEGELRPPPAQGGAAGLNAEAEEALSQFLAQPGTPSLSPTERVRALRLLAGALVVEGRYQEAAWLLERAREKLSTLPPEHPEQWRTLASFGRVLTLDGRGDEAEEALRCADERAESSLGKAGYLDRARILADLARLEHRLGRRCAASTARRALAFYGEVSGFDAERASTLQELAPIVEAEPVLRS
ncbi:hypothetical protein [Sorangium sp. So ce124]|uniref:hypothetical protein n=1 Tax=Sorangium sp. So ce124 TaxID=3133280 RepID=UPI003F606297